MVILIGGSSHVGKTLLSQKLIEKYHFPCTSLDHLKMGMIRTGWTDIPVTEDLKLRYVVWPFAAEMVKTAVENGQNMILEGCYIPGEWKESFTAEYLENIRCVFLVMSEPYIRSHEKEIGEYADVIEHRLEDETDIERLVLCSRNFKKDCEENGIPCLEITDRFDIDVILERAERLLGL